MTSRGRDALLGAAFVLIAALAVLATAVRRGRSAGLSDFSVLGCLENLADCRGKALIRLHGAYVPGSQMWPRAGCQSEFDLQTPSAQPPGKIRVCSAQAVTPALDSESAGPLAEYLQRGLLLVEATGRFDGARMNASSVSVVSPGDRGFYRATFDGARDAGK